MGHFGRKLARGMFMDKIKGARKQQRHDQKWIDAIIPRWKQLTAEFHDCRIYAGGILEAEAERVKKEGVKLLYAVPKGHKDPAHLYEVTQLDQPLRENATGDIVFFGLKIKPGEIQPLKLARGFVIKPFMTAPEGLKPVEKLPEAEVTP